jgi:hypothetical protein
MNTRSTLGRRQPYDATALAAMTYAAAPPGVPMNSFYRHNYNDPNVVPTNTTTSTATLKLPFDWLPHLDRQLVSPVELLQVSAHKPHELTHTFARNVGPAYLTNQQMADWTDQAAPAGQSTRLYRFFEMVETASRLPGAAVGGRIPGRININTLAIDAPEVFLAMCDAQPGNCFFNPGAGQGDSVALDVFTQLMKYRNFNATGVPNINDQPFKSFGIGPYAGPGAGDAMDPANVFVGNSRARGVNDTLFRQIPPVGGVQVSTLYAPTLPPPTPPNPAYHPYQQRELLNKVFNNLTTRSNTFAVFLTIGFFEVTDETTRPVKLGPEINAAQGTNIRHRVFAIVDRTSLTAFQTGLNTAVAPVETPVDATVLTDGLGGINPKTGKPWKIQDGTVLVFDPNTTNEETVRVYAKGAGLFALFTKPHLKGGAVVCRGNPGPWLRYDPRQDSEVVPFFALID